MYQFIGNYINPVIIVFGLIILFVLVLNAIKLYTKKAFIYDAMNRKNKETFINSSTLEVEEREKKEAITPDTIRDYEKSFHEVVSVYNVCAQLIPLFPILGILGTVSGLIQLLSAGIDRMSDSLGTALNSTFLGLVFTIILKTVATVSAKTIEDTEIVLEDYDKKIDNSVKLGNISSN